MRFIYLFVSFVLCAVKIEFSFVLALRNKALLLSGILACPRQGQLESWPFPSWRVPAVAWRDELDSWQLACFRQFLGGAAVTGGVSPA